MKANEVRLGNWFIVNGKYDQMWGSWLDGISWDDDLTERIDIKPIPLTPEILEKCGFEDQGGLMADDNDVWVSVPRMKVGLYMQPCEQDFQISVQYLHQLQNLYFALTGEELNIEL